MNVPTFIKRFILAAGLALTVAGMAAGAVGAQDAGDQTIATRGQTSIVTDKDNYLVGEPISITYTLPASGWYRITDAQGGKVSTLRSGFSAEASGRIAGTVTPPAGKECLHLDYWGSFNQPDSAETCFQVSEKAEPPRAEVPAPGRYTLRHREASLLLASTVLKKVYLASDVGDLQMWVLEPAPDGYFFLRDLATGYYLESNPGGDVTTNEQKLGIFQQWKVGPGREGTMTLIHRPTGLKLGAHAQGGVFADSEGSVLDGYEWTLTAVQP